MVPSKLPFFPYSAIFALLVIRLKSSKRLALTLTLAHFTAIGLMWPLDLHILVRLLGILLLAASLAFYVKRYAWLASPGSVTGLELLDRHDLCGQNEAGEKHSLCTARQQLRGALSYSSRIQTSGAPATLAKSFCVAQHCYSPGWHQCGGFSETPRIIAMEMERFERAGLGRGQPRAREIARAYERINARPACDSIDHRSASANRRAHVSPSRSSNARPVSDWMTSPSKPANNLWVALSQDYALLRYRQKCAVPDF